MKEGWTYKKLGEVGTFVRGGGFLKRDYVENGIPCIHYGQIHTVLGNVTTEHLTSISEELRSKTKFASKGDVIFAITSEDVEGSCKCTAWMGDYDVAVGGHAAIYKSSLNPAYVSYYAKSPVFYNAKKQYVHGFKVMEIKPADIAQIDIPVPSLDEQQRIVERLDAAFENIDKLKANAEKQLAEARTLFQKSLAKAMEPKEGWEEKKLKEIAQVRIGPFGSLLHKKDYISGGIPLVNPIHMVNGNIVANNDFTISNEKAKELSNYLLKENDIIFARRGEVGRCAIVTGKDEGSLCGTGSLFVRFLREIDSNFMLLLFQSECCKNYLVHNASGATMLNINAGIVEDMPLIIPSLAEQQRIVERLDGLSENIRKYEEIQRQIISECDALKQALLRKVFE